jgi:hypothetical protein
MKLFTHPNQTAAARRLAMLAALCGALAWPGASARASIAYGTLNNFDTVNDTGQICYGFEIELDDLQSRGVTYCYSYNHYGTPSIREDTTSVPGHTNVFVRYAAILTNGVWSAYTAIPAGPIAPTLGHQFTNPSTNFGGEHFGVGYSGQPTSIKYNWLVDDGSGALVHGPAVLVSTPLFTYYPPAPGVPAQVQAEVQPAPEVQVEAYGSPAWVNQIRTAVVTNREIRLRDLVSPDPAYPNDKDWRNGEPDEVESEWSLMQTEFGSNKTNQLLGAAQALTNGNEVLTRRYEYYAYVGPTDASGKALASKVGRDGIHGVNQYSNTVVVGNYLGAQMSGYNHALGIGLIDHVADGTLNAVYPARTVVVAGVPFSATMSGALPPGMNFDAAAGTLSGTPTQSGIFTFKVRVSATNNPTLEKSYTFAVPAAGVVLAPHSTVDIVSDPLDSGATTGTGLYTNGVTATVTATAAPGYKFLCWSDHGQTISSNAVFQLPVTLNVSLVASFMALPQLAVSPGAGNTLTLSWPTNFAGFLLQKNSDLNTTNWVGITPALTVVGTNNQVNLSPVGARGFFRLMHP